MKKKKGGVGESEASEPAVVLLVVDLAGLVAVLIAVLLVGLEEEEEFNLEGGELVVAHAVEARLELLKLLLAGHAGSVRVLGAVLLPGKEQQPGLALGVTAACDQGEENEGESGRRVGEEADEVSRKKERKAIRGEKRGNGPNAVVFSWRKEAAGEAEKLAGEAWPR